MKKFLNTWVGLFSWPIIITALIVIITVVSQQPDGTRWAFAVPLLMWLFAVAAFPSKTTVGMGGMAGLIAIMGLLASRLDTLLSFTIQGAVIISLGGFLIGVLEVRNKLKNRGWTSIMLAVLQLFCLCLILEITPFGWHWEWGLVAMFAIITVQLLLEHLEKKRARSNRALLIH